MLRRLLLAAAVLLTATGCATHAGAPPAPPPPTVEVVAAQQRDVPIYGEWVGTLDGMVNADIKAQVSGNLLRQDYHEGSWVKKGQLLFEIDPRPFEAAVAQAEGQLAQTRGALGQAESQLAQAQAVLEQAKSQVLGAQAVRSQAKSQLLSAQAALAQARAGQHKTDLDVQKYRPLAEKKAVTQQDLDNAVQADLVARAGVEAARAQVQNATSGVASAEAQIGTSRAAILSAQAQVGTARAAIVSAQAQVRTAEANVESAQINLGFTRITSPIDGIAGLAHLQVGNLVSPTTDPLTTVSTVNPIKAIFTVSEQEYLDAARRDKSDAGAYRHKLRFELIQSDGSIYPHPGRFYAEDRNVSQNTGSIRITALFPNPGNVLRPGQYARVRAVRYVVKDAVLVPQRAVSELQSVDQIAVVGTDNKVDLRRVHVGERVGSDWIIRDGLKGGERVIVEGTLKIGPGAAVEPKPYTSPSASPAAVKGH
jgi:membrane fusion protein (multidrug efflux system)